ncbi:hypothetical protein [Paraliobacillus salinarum]|uniref:hypothetical protein n=1 Tax=Paraliobacillus salinarum TaxID=1158996 RepID=UPI0015F47B6A|nr:hypothetical protein [Paraliobacillus salinarum]
MKKIEKESVEDNRRKLAIKSMYYNRYLLVRYVSALFFFTNLYWLISLSMSSSNMYILPLALMIIILFSVAEQVKIFSKHTNNPKLTKYCFMAIFFTNILLIISTCFSPIFTKLYPFLTNQVKSQFMVLTVLSLGLLLSTLILLRLYKIKQNTDKHFTRIKAYEEAIN